ncbi:ABC transporter ATP-binding protein [Sulfuriferula sp. AH1]|uniref:ABC transporter ATP-binding protein n=1 Tax=Sulfuriferula sp. AH1 TaxID=1985873 RepID=UPI000B3B184F|nr:ABC transporter ATP-binding protein [Sulfuriferula sp. AH1]ARU30574.1 ABC transporter ATP-binding protein [Sulfuriferula sp. AH1]
MTSSIQCPVPVPGVYQLEVQAIHQGYDDQAVVKGLSFKLAQGTIGCLLGPSGCGKTTVLRGVAGFEPVGGGEIIINGASVSRSGFMLPPEQRRVGMVFQDYALFPHLNVADNIGFGLHGMSRRERVQRVTELLEVVGLPDSGRKFSHELSGGQQQRVALARALAPCPALLLLDEPFSSLDVALRERLGQEVRDILKQQNTTALMVTHDQNEAFAIADEIGVMNHGILQQWDTAYNLYHQPASRFVADFIGEGVLIPGTVRNGNQVETVLGTLAGEIPPQCGSACKVEVLLRPDDVVHDDASTMQAEVVHKVFRGADILYTLMLAGGQKVLSLVSSHHNHAYGEMIGIRIEADHVVVFPCAAA